MRTLLVLPIVEQLRIGGFRPFPRDRTDFLGEGTDDCRNLDPLRGEEGILVFPVKPRRGYARVGQPIEGDVVDNVVARQSHLLAVKYASDLAIGPDVMIDDPC